MKIAVLNGSPRKENTYAMVEAFKDGAEDAGIITASGEENKSEAKLAEIREFAKNL